MQNLTVDNNLRQQLIAAYVVMKQIPAADVASTSPGSTYYAYDPAKNTYYAMSRFTPASGVPQQVLVGFQDGGEMGLFEKVGSGPWQAQLGTEPNYCGELKTFPAPVLTVWALPTTVPPGGEPC